MQKGSDQAKTTQPWRVQSSACVPAPSRGAGDGYLLGARPAASGQQPRASCARGCQPGAAAEAPRAHAEKQKWQFLSWLPPQMPHTLPGRTEWVFTTLGAGHPQHPNGQNTALPSSSPASWMRERGLRLWPQRTVA